MRYHLELHAPHEIIAARRTELSMTQTELANKLGYKPNFVSMLESQKSSVPIGDGRAIAIAEALEMDPMWFIEKVMKYENETGRKTYKELADYIFNPVNMRRYLRMKEAETKEDAPAGKRVAA